MSNNIVETVPWQYIAFSDDPYYADLQSKHNYLVRKFASLSRKNDNFAQTAGNLARCEREIAEKQIADWLAGADLGLDSEYPDNY